MSESDSDVKHAIAMAFAANVNGYHADAVEWLERIPVARLAEAMTAWFTAMESIATLLGFDTTGTGAVLMRRNSLNPGVDEANAPPNVLRVLELYRAFTKDWSVYMRALSAVPREDRHGVVVTTLAITSSTVQAMCDGTQHKAQAVLGEWLAQRN